MSNKYLFTFAAKGLQSYIMRGGKLRDMVGATSLVDKLSDERELRKRLEETFGLMPADFEILQSAAGGARIKFNDEKKAKEVNRLWPLWCHAWAPDLDVVQHLELWDEKSYGQVSKTAGEQLERNRNFPAPRMPEAGPFAKRAPRTGAPAVQVDHKADKELIDLASKRKRAERDSLAKAGKLPPVAESFTFSEADQLPDDFEQVSGGQGAYLAVVHADGNRLGQMFLDVGQALAACGDGEMKGETGIELFRYLSQHVVARGTQEAVRNAMAAIKEKIDAKVDENRQKASENPKAWEQRSPEAWPFAPIVLAGDDVTIVCRADLGLLFTEAFLTAFAKEMKDRLEGIEKQDWWGGVPTAVRQMVPKNLSAGAGVVFCTDHYPFSLAYELCESLAKEAKGAAKKLNNDHNSKLPCDRLAPPSALSFVRIAGSSAPTQFEDLTTGILKGSDGTLLTGGPYFVGGEAKPQLSALWNVYEKARPRTVKEPVTEINDQEHNYRVGLPSTSLRGLLNFQRTSIGQVHDAVARMEEVAGGHEDDRSYRRKAWNEFKKAWNDLCGTTSPERLQFDRSIRSFTRRDSAGMETQHDCSPLFDLLTLLAVRDKADDDKPVAPTASTSTAPQS